MSVEIHLEKIAAGMAEDEFNIEPYVFEAAKSIVGSIIAAVNSGSMRAVPVSKDSIQIVCDGFVIMVEDAIQEPMITSELRGT